MSSKTNTGISDIIERLSRAKVINTDVSLKATLEAVSGGSSLAYDGIDVWCGTIRRPWVIIRHRFDFEEQLSTLNSAIKDLKEVTGGLKSQR